MEDQEYSDEITAACSLLMGLKMCGSFDEKLCIIIMFLEALVAAPSKLEAVQVLNQERVEYTIKAAMREISVTKMNSRNREEMSTVDYIDTKFEEFNILMDQISENTELERSGRI